MPPGHTWLVAAMLDIRIEPSRSVQEVLWDSVSLALLRHAFI